MSDIWLVGPACELSRGEAEGRRIHTHRSSVKGILSVSLWSWDELRVEIVRYKLLTAINVGSCQDWCLVRNRLLLDKLVVLNHVRMIHFLLLARFLWPHFCWNLLNNFDLSLSEDWSLGLLIEGGILLVSWGSGNPLLRIVR